MPVCLAINLKAERFSVGGKYRTSRAAQFFKRGEDAARANSVEVSPRVAFLGAQVARRGGGEGRGEWEVDSGSFSLGLLVFSLDAKPC